MVVTQLAHETVRSCLREVMPSLTKTFRRCHSTVCVLMNSCEPISDWSARPPQAARSAPPGRSVRRRSRSLFAHLLTGRDKFPSGALGETLRAHRGEHLESGVELLASVQAAIDPAQPFAVRQPDARQVQHDVCAFETLDGLGEQVFSVFVVGKKGLRSCHRTQPPVGPARARPRLESGQGRCGGCVVAEVCRGFDEFDRGTNCGNPRSSYSQHSRAAAKASSYRPRPLNSTAAVNLLTPDQSSFALGGSVDSGRLDKLTASAGMPRHAANSASDTWPARAPSPR